MLFDVKNRHARDAHTVLELKYHYVWKTKYAYPVLTGDIGLRARDLLRQICSEQAIRVVRGHVRSNHIHLLISAPHHLSPAKIAQCLKAKSADRLLREFPELKKRYRGRHLWSCGYFCCTVGAVTEEMVKRYIEDQADTPQGFKVWDEESQPAPDFSAPAFKPSAKPSS